MFHKNIEAEICKIFKFAKFAKFSEYFTNNSETKQNVNDMCRKPLVSYLHLSFINSETEILKRII